MMSYLCSVVGDAVVQPRVVHGDLPPVAGQVEAEQRGRLEDGRGAAHEQVAAVLRPQRRLSRKPMPPAATANFQLNSGSL